MREESTPTQPEPLKPWTSTLESGSRAISVWEAALPILPQDFDEMMGLGMTAESILSPETPLVFSDFPHFILPGLRASGVHAKLEPLFPVAFKRTPRHPVPLLKFEGDPFAPVRPSVDPNILTTPFPSAAEKKLVLIAQGMFVGVENERYSWIEIEPVERFEKSGDWNEFSARHTALLRVSRATRKGGLRENREAAIQRWATLFLAYPERTIRRSVEVENATSLPAAFLAEIAGNRKDSLALRWRKASEAMSGGDIELAWELILETALRTLNLPDRLFSTLNAPPEFVLHPSEKRELLYFARAGTRSLRLFAMRRLASELQDREIRTTFEALVYAPDAFAGAMSARLLNLRPAR